MDILIFFVGFLVTMTVVYGVFSQVPPEIAPPDEVEMQIKQNTGEAS